MYESIKEEIIYSSDGQAEFSVSLLQSSVLHAPSDLVHKKHSLLY